MSTSYYRFKKPISSVRLEENYNGRDRITVWEKGMNCGSLLFSFGEGRKVLDMFKEKDSVCIRHATTNGSKLSMYAEIQDDEDLIDEYGKVDKFKDIK